MAAFSIEQLNFVDKPMFNISIEQRSYQRDTQGNFIKQINYLQLEPCTLDHFQLVLNQPDYDFEQEYQKLQLNKWLCPQKDFQFTIQGTFTSNYFDFIRVIVSDCDDSQSGYQNWNPTCATQSSQVEYLNTHESFKLQIYQVNNVVNPNSPQQYYQSYLDGEMYFTFTPQKLSRQANLFFRKYQFQNDDSLLPFQSINEKELIVRQSVDYREITEIGRQGDKNYGIVYLRRSQFSEYIDRRFTKIDELLSFLGGFLQIMITGFGIFIMYYNKLQLQIELSNKLFNFPEKFGKAKVKNNQVQQTLDSSMYNDSKFIVNSEQGASKATLVIDKEKSTLTKSILKLFEQSQRLKLSLKSLINHLSFKLIFNNDETKLFQKAMDTVDQHLDIQEILYQLQELFKLKTLILKKQQITLFNFTPKPNLTLKDEEQVPNRLMFEQALSENEKQGYQKDELISELYNAWIEIKSDKTQNECQYELNQRLNQELGNEIQQYFQDYLETENNLKKQKENSQQKRLTELQNL
ncbi:unnamed protein product (macronuclear) [Paramecium tetraurelia]|uniref:Transmembrane protein n=1 Tax=Paramecium tetraurelia TaxID=5888 RepID=A0BQC8_PARTE|nr:uncharacterized protein GSPATT00030974001 [Paramecium tetraurelia]CAK60745.1 unnamed protein product [Paramecium tetraurelia]|eukprot:XP_001428143.1 hypothetical protein (macronuclear) [Paramecium tetraurelia strain d4-2]